MNKVQAKRLSYNRDLARAAFVVANIQRDSSAPSHFPGPDEYETDLPGKSKFYKTAFDGILIASASTGPAFVRPVNEVHPQGLMRAAHNRGNKCLLIDTRTPFAHPRSRALSRPRPDQSTVVPIKNAWRQGIERGER
jgi:hypothetical protein